MLIAIDPGVSGGIAYEDTDGSVHAYPMPRCKSCPKACEHDAVKLAQHLGLTIRYGDVVYLEELPRHQGKMSGSSMATLFLNYGRIQGVLAAYFHTCETRLIRPQKWQKLLGVGESKDHGNGWKNHLKKHAEKLFPHLDITLKTADALLILAAAKTIQEQ